MGGSVGKSKSDAKSENEVWGGQEGALGNLYGNAQNLYRSQDQQGLQNQAQQITPFMGDVAQQAQGAYQNMLGGGSVGGNQDQIMQNLMKSLSSTAGGSQTGKMYNSIVGGEGNTYIDPMVDAMKGSSMENLARMQSGTGMDAAAMGQGGSSRHAMQNAMQARDINRDMLDRETAMRGGAYDTDLNMKLDIARQADAGIQNTQQNYMNLLGAADQNTQSGMGYGSNLQGLGMGSMAPQMAADQNAWGNMGSYANTIGAPTILGSGSQSGKGANVGASIKG